MTEEKRLLAEWLKSHNYVQCSNFEMTSFEAVKNTPEDSEIFQNTWNKDVASCKIRVFVNGIMHNLEVNFEKKVSFLESYAHIVLDDDFMVLIDLNENMLSIYKQNPVW